MTKLTEPEWLAINTLVEKLHQYQENQGARTYFLLAVKPLITYDFGVIDLSKLKNGKFVCLHDPIINSIFDKRFEEEFIALHDQTFCRMSYTRWIHHEKKPLVYNETDILNQQIREKSQYYNEYLKPGGLVFSCGCNLVHNELNLGAVTFYRKREQQDFTSRDLYILELLQPHLITKISQCVELEQDSDPRHAFSSKHDLTNREMEIIELVYKGLGNQDIGNRLHISVHTVKKHLNNIFCKLGIKSRSQLNHLLNKNEFAGSLTQ